MTLITLERTVNMARCNGQRRCDKERRFAITISEKVKVEGRDECH